MAVFTIACVVTEHQVRCEVVFVCAHEHSFAATESWKDCNDQQLMTQLCSKAS